MPDDTLMVHSSFKFLGNENISAETVIKALIESLPDSTLLMPALSWVHVAKNNFTFLINNTPTCIGTLPEVFRLFPGVVRSMYPIHSVCAFGISTEEITSCHHMDRTPVGILAVQAA